LDEQAQKSLATSVLLYVFPHYQYQPTLYPLKGDYYLLLELPRETKIQKRALEELEDKFLYSPLISLNAGKKRKN